MIKTPLRDYQREAVERAVSRLRSGGGFALFPEQRVGKTLTALAVVDRVKPHWLIVVCPKAAIAEWVKQTAEHLSVDWRFQATVINYEALANNRKTWYKWVKERSRRGVRIMVICDESHYIKRRGASRSRVVRNLAGYCSYRLALTGTPIAQGIQDAWAQFDFIDPAIFGTWDEFSERYLVWGGYKKHQIIKYRNEDEFYQRFHENSYRITLREAKRSQGKTLAVHYRKIPVALGQRAVEAYEELKSELITIVNEKKVKVKNVLACITKLQQITGGTVLDEDRYPQTVGSEKIEALKQIIRSMRARSKFIVISRFLHEIDRIKRFLEKEGYSVTVVRGGEPFDGKFRSDVIVMQIQSGIARDMSAADAIVYYSPDYSYINLEQSKSRILSLDKAYAKYIFLLAKGTVDELIYLSITRKTDLAKLVCDKYRSRRGAKK